MDIDGDIPEGWKKRAIREVGEVVTGRTPSTQRPEFYGEGYNLISPADLDGHKYVGTAHRSLTRAGFEDCRGLPKDTVLVGCIGNVGKLGMIPDDRSATNQQINAVICNAEHDPHFIYYRLYKDRGRLERSAVKTTVPILNKTNFESFEVVVPPLAEQRKIAAVLGLVQRAIEQQERLIALTSELKKALLHKLLTEGLRGESQKQTEIGLVPESWFTPQIGDITAAVYRYPSYYNISYIEHGVPEVRGELLLENGEIQSDKEKFRYISEQTAARFPKVRLDIGDIVMSVRGTMGKIGLVRDDLAAAVITANLIRLAPNRARVLPGFFRWALLTPRFQAALNGASPQTTIKTITAPVLKSLRLPLPSKEEQTEIASALDAVDTKLSGHEHKVSALRDLFRTLLHELMTAQIRINDLNLDLDGSTNT
jgi:type I restriction enzyme, S subunit